MESAQDFENSSPRLLTGDRRGPGEGTCSRRRGESAASKRSDEAVEEASVCLSRSCFRLALCSAGRARVLLDTVCGREGTRCMCAHVWGCRPASAPHAASEPRDLRARPVPAPRFPQCDTGSRPAPQGAAGVGATSRLGEHRLRERQRADRVWTEHGCVRAVYLGPWGAVPSLSTGSRPVRWVPGRCSTRAGGSSGRVVVPTPGGWKV